MKLSSFHALLGTMMSDKMDVYGYNTQENEDGTTSSVLDTTPKYKNVKCRLSFNAKDNPKDTEVDEIPVRYSPKVFCLPSLKLNTGDEIVVRRCQDDGTIMSTHKGKIGEPASYPSHIEVSFFIEESA